MCTSNGPLDDWFGIPNASAVAQQQAQAAQQAEAQRRAQIQKVIDAINAVYNDPAVAQQISDIAAKQYANWLDQITRGSAQSERALKAQAARQGIIGSSAWEQKQSALQAAAQKALADAEARKAALQRKIQSAIEQSRQNLISQAQSGLSLTRAQQLADQSLAQALAQGAANAATDIWNQAIAGLALGVTDAAKQQGKKAAQSGYAPVAPATTPSSALAVPNDQTASSAVTGGY